MGCLTRAKNYKYLYKILKYIKLHVYHNEIVCKTHDIVKIVCKNDEIKKSKKISCTIYFMLQFENIASSFFFSFFRHPLFSIHGSSRSRISAIPNDNEWKWQWMKMRIKTWIVTLQTRVIKKIYKKENEGEKREIVQDGNTIKK